MHLFDVGARARQARGHLARAHPAGRAARPSVARVAPSAQAALDDERQRQRIDVPAGQHEPTLRPANRGTLRRARPAPPRRRLRRRSSRSRSSITIACSMSPSSTSRTSSMSHAPVERQCVPARAPRCRRRSSSSPNPGASPLSALDRREARALHADDFDPGFEPFGRDAMPGDEAAAADRHHERVELRRRRRASRGPSCPAPR